MVLMRRAMAVAAGMLCSLSCVGAVGATGGTDKKEPHAQAEEAAALGLQCVELAQACSTAREIALKALENATSARADASLAIVEAGRLGGKDAVKRAEKLRRSAITAHRHCEESVEDISKWHAAVEQETLRAQDYAKIAVGHESERKRKSALARVKRCLRKIEGLENRIKADTEILKKRWLLMQEPLLPVSGSNAPPPRVEGAPVTIPQVTPVDKR